jgi:hypothetical protein
VLPVSHRCQLQPRSARDRSCDRSEHRDLKAHHIRRIQKVPGMLRSWNKNVRMPDCHTMRTSLLAQKVESCATTYMAPRTFAGDH